MRVIFVIMLTFITAFISILSFAQNRVLSLDGEGDYVEIKDSEALNNIGSQVTVEAWIKPTSFPNQWIALIYKGDIRISDARENRSYTLWLNRSGSIHLSSAPEGQGSITPY